MNNVLWEAFEIAVNFFQGFIVIYFPYKYLGDKQGRRYGESPAVIYAVLYASALSIVNQVTVFEHFLALIYISITIVYTFTCLNGSCLLKIFAALFPNIILATISSFVANFAAVLFGTDLYSMLSCNNIERFTAIIATQLLILYSTIFSLKLLNSHKNDGGLVVGEWILISIVLIISITIGALLNLISLDPSSHNGRVYLVVVFVGVILINIVVCYLIVDLSKKNKAVRENELLKLTQEYSRQYAKNSAIEYDVIRKLRHDFKDSFSVIYTLLSDGNIENAMQLIKENIDATEKMMTFVKTDNDVVNAVINAKLSTAKSLGVDSTCLSVMNFDGIETLDLCRLLANMLENAITACVNSKVDRKQIYLKISSDEYNYTFYLKNTISESVIDVNPALNTTKDHKDEHGFGTQIIRDIVNKYNGRCDFYEEDNCFCCNVILKR